MRHAVELDVRPPVARRQVHADEDHRLGFNLLVVVKPPGEALDRQEQRQIGERAAGMLGHP